MGQNFTDLPPHTTIFFLLDKDCHELNASILTSEGGVHSQSLAAWRGDRYRG